MENLESKINKRKSVELIDAIYAKDLKLTQELLNIINKELTGTRKDLIIDKEDLEKFINGEKDFLKIYFGDGGISRMIIYNEGGKIDIEISRNSDEEVIKKWQQI